MKGLIAQDIIDTEEMIVEFIENVRTVIIMMTMEWWGLREGNEVHFVRDNAEGILQ